MLPRPRGKTEWPDINYTGPRTRLGKLKAGFVSAPGHRDCAVADDRTAARRRRLSQGQPYLPAVQFRSSCANSGKSRAKSSHRS